MALSLRESPLFIGRDQSRCSTKPPLTHVFRLSVSHKGRKVPQAKKTQRHPGDPSCDDVPGGLGSAGSASFRSWFRPTGRRLQFTVRILNITAFACCVFAMMMCWKMLIRCARPLRRQQESMCLLPIRNRPHPGPLPGEEGAIVRDSPWPAADRHDSGSAGHLEPDRNPAPLPDPPSEG